MRADPPLQDFPLRLTTFNDLEDELFGALGTPERTAYEARIIAERKPNNQDADSEASASC